MQVSIAQIAPVWLQKQPTISKICSFIEHAGKEKSKLVVFGEALLPGYPFWVSNTDGGRFESEVQKELYAHYVMNSICVEEGELEQIQKLAKEQQINVYVGVMERAKDRGGHSLYCSLVYINEHGNIGSIHRKLQPTYEERLVWAQGDGNGLKVHQLGCLLYTSDAADD